jgi:cytochrome P450
VLTFLNDALRRDPYPVYAAMRRFRPVANVNRRGIWALFDFESVKRALTDPEAFSSRAAPPGGAPLDWLIFMDPPRHSKLRALIARTFTPRSVANLEPRIAALASSLIDAVISRGEMDLVTELAERLPLLVIVEMMGMPLDDAPRVLPWADAILHLSDGIAGGERAARAFAAYRAAKAEMQPYLHDLVAERRAAPRDDLLTRLVESEVDGERLTEDEIFSFFQLLLLAGTETTTNLIANSVLCFLEHPDQLARLRATPELLPGAIEEVLRFRTPVQMVFRMTTRDVELRGRVIPEGRLVLAMVGSANRDARQFPNANRFDMTRTGAHVGFGHGAHFCIGAALARLETRVALSALLDRFSDIRRAGGAWAPRTGLNVHGPRSLPIRFTPSA